MYYKWILRIRQYYIKNAKHDVFYVFRQFRGSLSQEFDHTFFLRIRELKKSHSVPSQDYTIIRWMIYQNYVLNDPKSNCLIRCVTARMVVMKNVFGGWLLTFMTVLWPKHVTIYLDWMYFARKELLVVLARFESPIQSTLYSRPVTIHI